MTLYKWSQTASLDASADPTVNWAEGQSPSSVNDSARAMMAAVAKYRDDTAGAIVTTGTSTAYAVSTYQAFQSLAQLNGQAIAFTPHATNGATVTINVDSLGARPLRSSPGIELPAGTVIQGTPYAALYNNSDAAFYLVGLFGNPYNVPIGSCIDFFGTTAPNSSFVLAYGQAISRTAYSTLFSMFGTTYGVGDGSTTFNIPDLRGRVIAGKDDMGGSAASRLTATYFGASAAALGSAGGSQSHTLSLGELPTGITSSGSNSVSVTTTSSVVTNVSSGFTPVANPGSGSWGFNNTSPGYTTVGASGVNSTSVTSNNTGGNAHAIIPPTIIANKLLRII
ncbi:tail fiber protein [Bradyrhizobium diazoefficiens]|nr:phage tail protein [Bradyrhizobium diazoefficiens]MBR0846620.1 tail fiber protein [Bradyrhizobium diazoefficiens]